MKQSFKTLFVRAYKNRKRNIYALHHTWSSEQQLKNVAVVHCYIDILYVWFEVFLICSCLHGTSLEKCNMIDINLKVWSTVYPKKYAHGYCFAVPCFGYKLTDFPISIRLTSLALWQSKDCPSASKATLMNMDKYLMWIHYERLHNHNKAKHNKTVCIFLGIYCTWLPNCINFKWAMQLLFRDSQIKHTSRRVPLIHIGPLSRYTSCLIGLNIPYIHTANNILRPIQNGRHFQTTLTSAFSLNEKCVILI